MGGGLLIGGRRVYITDEVDPDSLLGPGNLPNPKSTREPEILHLNMKHCIHWMIGVWGLRKPCMKVAETQKCNMDPK